MASEIITWLKEHQETKQFLILDDLNLNHEGLASYQIQPKSEVGLTKEEVVQGINLLNRQG